MNKLLLNNKRGFTLIELLVVISIIGLLSSVILASLNSARTKAKLSKAFSSMNAINKVAYMCASDGSALIIPTSNSTGGNLVCAGQETKLPDISDTGFTYCGTNCGGWTSSGYSYAFSIYSGADGKIIVCGSDINVSGWYYGGSIFDFTGSVFCKKVGF